MQQHRNPSPNEPLVPTRDGGALLLGATNVTIFDLDVQLTRLDANGCILWTKIYGGSGIDYLSQGLELPNGDFILLGESLSAPSGTKNSPAYGNDDFWVVRLSPAGEMIWERTWGGSDRELAVSILFIGDAVYLFGHSTSPASGNKSSPNGGSFDNCVVKFSLAGE